MKRWNTGWRYNTVRFAENYFLAPNPMTDSKCEHKWQLGKLFSQKIGDESLCVEAMMATLICTECWGHKTLESKPITE